jgi:hypothetical protein
VMAGRSGHSNRSTTSAAVKHDNQLSAVLRVVLL